jgi:glutamate formiminotransferase
MFECVINVSEGRDAARLAAFEHAGGPSLRDRHSDPDHHRSVFTLVNDPAPLLRDVHALSASVIDSLDLRLHEGVHPRLGVLDVVPFVPLAARQIDQAVAMRDETARYIAEELGVPCFLYGPLDGRARTLPEVRRGAFRELTPEFGPHQPHERAGACAVGAREILVAWNIWIDGITLVEAKSLASRVRSPGVRALGLEVGSLHQVSCNLVDLSLTRPSQVYDAVAGRLPSRAHVVRCELVGLAPRALLEREDPIRWQQLDLDPARTIEARINR